MIPSTVALAANAHAALCMPNFLILEHCRHRPWFSDVQIHGPQIESGHVVPSDRPGLGVELDWDYIRKHPYRPLKLRTFQDRQGGIPLI